MIHGRYSTYSNNRCRCDACRAAWRDYQREYTHRTGRNRPMAMRRVEAEARTDNHGTESRYSFGCRCEACRQAASEARQRRRMANRG